MLTLQLPLHPLHPSNQRKLCPTRHLRTIHRMHALLHLICNRLVGLLLLTTDNKTLASMNRLQAGLTLGRHHPMVLVGMGLRVAVVSPNHMATLGLLPTAAMLE